MRRRRRRRSHKKDGTSSERLVFSRLVSYKYSTTVYFFLSNQSILPRFQLLDPTAFFSLSNLLNFLEPLHPELAQLSQFLKIRRV